ncbi:MAG TPA: DUF2520 domain-containing protein [Candidatus Coprenecus stercoravium]|uniref:DUF2520 domain-containing protein n=1 Tax=Candidatus Coprenecus stercoravium TaxID=2840735 RepID=A0A9D2GS07_9BACT|nr:DUF2520 domain-containing protein [Candidatus Coprenecus stercoravium]
MRPDISFIGAGNVAFRFSLALQEKGYRIPHIYSRTDKNRDRLVKALRVNGSDTLAANTLQDLGRDSLIFIAVSDDAIAGVVSALAEALADTDMRPSVVHTSGATDISVLKPLADMGCRCGVVYPLMTLSRNKNVEFKDVPLLLEAMSEDLAPVIDSIASDLGGEHYFYTSEQRLKMHVAAVFTTNFVNYLLGLAFPIVQHDHPLLIPGTIEAVRNAFLHTPASTLTGPARRGDTATIQKHLDVLDKLGLKEQEEIYRLFTDKILKKYHHDK